MTGWWSKNKPASGKELRSEAVAGIPGAIGSVPDGMAASVLTGVSPIHGLYASFAGPLVGGLSSSTKLMVVTTTSAAALAAGSALQDMPAEDRPEALFLLTVLAGVFMVLAGVFRLGKYTRFVSHSVMTGFLTGVAVNIVLSQFADLTGAPSEGDISLEKAINVLRDPGAWSMVTLATGIAALAIVVGMSRTRLSGYGALLALILPTLVLQILGTEGVLRVDDVGAIPTGIPLPQLPQLSSFTFAVVTGALAVAVIVLVQGAGVSESSPNLDGSRSDSNQDFISQGAGNIAAGLFKGQPVGGSVSQTALNASAGARTRWASIFSGIWMLLILVAFSGAVGVIAMSTLAAVLIYAAIVSIRPHQIATVWSSGLNSQIAIVTTFVATLFLPIAAAVGLGVAISLLLQLNQGLVDLRVVELRELDDGTLEERESPAHPASHSVTLLDVYGSLLYAGARSLQAQLPDPADTESPVVVLRLRGRLSFGATFAVVMSDYVERLADVGGHLVLSGVETSLMDQLRTSGGDDIEQHISVHTAKSVIGESTRDAIAQGQRWLDDQS